MTRDIQKIWRSLRPAIKDGFTFAALKDLVATAGLPVEQLAHLQQRSLPAKGASKSELMDAVDDLISREESPEIAIHRLLVAVLQLKPQLQSQVADCVSRYGWVLEGTRLRPVASESVDVSTIQNDFGNREAMEQATNMSIKPHDSILDIFISHSSRDTDVAEALIELIRSALDVPHAKIRCTSVDGYRLPAGASTDEQLQREVRDSLCFIALLTPSSLQSRYVLFELGARWGANLRFLPLLAKGLTAAQLGMPLASLNSLSCSSSAQIHQFLGDVGLVLGRELNSPATYDRHLKRVHSLASVEVRPSAPPSGAPTNSNASVPTDAQLGPRAKELLDLIEKETNVDERGIVQVLSELEPGKTYFFPRIQYAGEPVSMKTRLFWEAIHELLAQGRLYPPELNSSRNTRTYEYRPSEGGA